MEKIKEERCMLSFWQLEKRSLCEVVHKLSSWLEKGRSPRLSSGVRKEAWLTRMNEERKCSWPKLEIRWNMGLEARGAFN